MLTKAVVLVMFTVMSNGQTRVDKLGEFPTDQACQSKSALIYGGLMAAGSTTPSAMLCVTVPWPYKRAT